MQKVPREEGSKTAVLNLILSPLTENINYITGRPDQVHNCTILNISMTSFQIRCTEGFNGGLTQAFLLEVSVFCYIFYIPDKISHRG